jgi:hypothetical protein
LKKIKKLILFIGEQMLNKLKYNLLITCVLCINILNTNTLFSTLKVTSTDPNFGVGNSNSEFNKKWLCTNEGAATLNVTLTSSKSGRSPSTWGLDNLTENFKLEAGGTQNCGIKLTTNGTKGVGDVNAQIKADDGFERNVKMTFYTDLYHLVFVNGSEGQDLKSGELYKYIYSKATNAIDFDKNDFKALSPMIIEAKNFLYIGGSNGEIDSLTADRIAQQFLLGKKIFICGAESFYKLSKSHPEHKIWSVLRFDLSDEILFDNFQTPYNVTVKNLIDENVLTTNNFFQNPFNLTDRPIRKVIPRITNAMQNTKLFYLNDDETKTIGYSYILGETNITFLNIDLEGLFFDVNDPEKIGKFYDFVFDNLGTSVENNLFETNISPNVIAYPNPVSEFVNIPINEIDKSQILSNDLEIKIYDINSNLIKGINVSLENQILKVKTNNLPNGKYFVEIMSNIKIYKSNFTIMK